MTVRHDVVRTVGGGDRKVLDTAMGRAIALAAAAMLTVLLVLLWPASLGGATTLVDDGGDIVVVREADPEVGDVVAYVVPGRGEAVATVSERRLDGRLAVRAGAGASIPLPADAHLIGVEAGRIPGAAPWLAVIGSPLVPVAVVAGVAALVLVWALHHDGRSHRRQLQQARARAAAARRPLELPGGRTRVIHRH